MIKKHLINIFWNKPSFESEKEEFERTAKELNLSFEVLKNAFKSGQVKQLTNNIWQKLENTDSWQTDTMEKVKKLAEEYNKDLDSIINAKKLPMPIILKNKNEYYLIAGNTRLMYSRANKINPQIFLITL